MVIREFLENDCLVISSAFSEQGWHKPVSRLISYWRESIAGARLLRVVERENIFAGYVTIVWESGYPPFRAAGIPEIVDLDVQVKYQHHGIGTALLDEAEKEVARGYSTVGIGVGITSDYGKAQALYIRRGYIPDG